MSTSLIPKRSSHDTFVIPIGAIVAIVVGVAVAVIVSIACCCPCWKKGGARPRSVAHSGPGAEDVGKEMGRTAELDGNGAIAQGRVVHEASAEEVLPPSYEEAGGAGSRGRGDDIAELPTRPKTAVAK